MPASDAPRPDPAADDVIEFGRTAGGGGAGSIQKEWPNPAVGAFDGVAWEPGVAKPDPILIADSIVRQFGGLRAVDVEHVEVQRGAITALIGPNGAGKTTFFNLLTNFDEPDRGSVVFDGRPATGVKSHLLAERGMVRTFQLTKVLAKMSVLDNMMLAAQEQRGESMWRGLIGGWGSQESDVRAQALDVLDQFNMTHMQDEFAGALSGGQRKLLEMARSMMANPRLIMLDEPMAGVNPALTQSLLGHVKRLRSEGITVMFVEHDMDVVADISDWVIVMAEGEIIAEGPPASIGANEAVQEAYLGSGAASLTEELHEVVEHPEHFGGGHAIEQTDDHRHLTDEPAHDQTDEQEGQP
jgi:neutral amino acid transport system ATP-binding protein